MPEPLSREPCERLAKAFPEEIGAHRFEEGDLRYRTTLGAYADTPLLVYELNDRSKWHASTTDVWIPTLEDLLALAQCIVGDGWIHLMSHPTWWECGHGNADGDGKFVSAGDTPTEAVANWLLAQKHAR